MPTLLEDTIEITFDWTSDKESITIPITYKNMTFTFGEFGNAVHRGDSDLFKFIIYGRKQKYVPLSYKRVTKISELINPIELFKVEYKKCNVDESVSVYYLRRDSEGEESNARLQCKVIRQLYKEIQQHRVEIVESNKCQICQLLKLKWTKFWEEWKYMCFISKRSYVHSFYKELLREREEKESKHEDLFSLLEFPCKIYDYVMKTDMADENEYFTIDTLKLSKPTYKSSGSEVYMLDGYKHAWKYYETYLEKTGDPVSFQNFMNDKIYDYIAHLHTGLCFFEVPDDQIGDFQAFREFAQDYTSNKCTFLQYNLEIDEPIRKQFASLPEEQKTVFPWSIINEESELLVILASSNLKHDNNTGPDNVVIDRQGVDINMCACITACVNEIDEEKVAFVIDSLSESINHTVMFKQLMLWCKSQEVNVNKIYFHPVNDECEALLKIYNLQRYCINRESYYMYEVNKYKDVNDKYLCEGIFKEYQNYQINMYESLRDLSTVDNAIHKGIINTKAKKLKPA